MKIIVVSSEDGYTSELSIVVNMLKEGLDIFHIRKPNFSEDLMVQYLNAIPEIYYNRIVLHSFHDLAIRYSLRGIHLTKKHKKQWLKNYFRQLWFKFKNPKMSISTSSHTLSRLKRYSNKYDYIFLSPVFNSVSNKKRYAGFSFSKINEKLNKIKKNNVFAFGGVSESRITKSKEIGFAGVVLYGCLWKKDIDPLEKFVSIKRKLESKLER